MSDCKHEWHLDEHDHVRCAVCAKLDSDVKIEGLRAEVERLRADRDNFEARLEGVMKAVRRIDPNAGLASCTEGDHVDRIVDEVERLRTRGEALAVALTTIEKVGCMQRDGDEEFWCRKDDSAHSSYCPRGIARAALAEWEKP